MSRFNSIEALPLAMREQAKAQLESVPRGTKPSKYGNTRVQSDDGVWFDSKFELTRWTELRNMQHLGVITELRRQVSFGLDAASPDGPVRIGAYISDFCYRRDDQFVIEDVKSPATKREKLYVWKRNHVERQYSVKITEVLRTRRRAA